MAGKSRPMADEDLRAFDPIPFPAIGPDVEFNANFCRNPMCPNFGPAPDLASYAKRYRVEAHPDFLADRHYKCATCGMTSRLLSNLSLRAAHTWFKRQSIPYDACGKSDCANEGVNVFEHWDRYRSDWTADAYKVRCRGRQCRSATYLGSPLTAHRSRAKDGELEDRMRAVFKGVWTGVRVRKLIESMRHDGERLTADHYGVLLRSVASRIRDYQSYCNAGFMAAGYPDRLEALFRAANEDAAPGVEDNPFNGTAALQTDTMFVPVRLPTSSYADREQQVPFLVTALRINEPKSWFLLSLHPCAAFRDGKAMPQDPAEALADAMLPVAERRFDYLFHYGTDHGQTALKGKKFSYLGGGALLMRDEYAELAHFMVLKEMTRRFRRVTLTMDGKHTAYRSAAAVFAGEMQTPCEDDAEGRCAEIAVVQTLKRARAGQRAGSPPRWDDEIKRVTNGWRDRTEEGLAGPAPEAKADLFRRAMRGARSKAGSWAWLRRRKKHAELAVLWLSQGPDREWSHRSKTVKALLKFTSTQRVDSVIGTIRRNATYLQRPPTRAEGGAGYVGSAGNIELLSCQAWLAWFIANYGRVVGTGDKRPADLVGLEHDVEETHFNLVRRRQLRLGWRDAEKMTERLGNG